MEIKSVVTSSIAVAICLMLVGCAPNVVLKTYTPPPASSAATIQASTDSFRNSDIVRISIVELQSCQSKVELTTVHQFQSGLPWQKEITEATFTLPADKNITLELFSYSSTAFVTTSCRSYGAYRFAAGSTYKLKVKNWSSVENPGLMGSSFGCKFDFFDETGKVFAPVESELPKCGDEVTTEGKKAQ